MPNAVIRRPAEPQPKMPPTTIELIGVLMTLMGAQLTLRRVLARVDAEEVRALLRRDRQ
jgi:hypothetical protein